MTNTRIRPTMLASHARPAITCLELILGLWIFTLIVLGFIIFRFWSCSEQWKSEKTDMQSQIIEHQKVFDPPAVDDPAQVRL